MRVPEVHPAPTRKEQVHAILLALCCAVLFLRSALLPGRVLVPHVPEFYDVYAAEAAARGTLDLDDCARGNLSMGDKYGQSLCWDRVMMDRLRGGEVPRWTNDIAGGASFVPQMAQVWEPINALLLLLPSAQWYGWWWLLHLVLFGFLGYRFVRRLGCAHESGLLAVVCATLGLWTQCKIHHNVILTAALSLWPMLSATHALVRERAGARAVAWLALWAGLSWMSGFAVVSLQVSYLTVGAALVWTMANAHGDRLRPLLRVGAGLGLGALLSCCQMIPVLLAAAESARDPTFGLAELQRNSLEWDHALTALWPDLLVWAGDHVYPTAGQGALALQEPTRLPWAQLALLAAPDTGRVTPNWVESSFSIGLPAFACALLALHDRRRRAFALYLLGAAVVAFGFATGMQPFLALARVLPGAGAADLRRWLFVVAMAGTVLAALGADRVREVRWPLPPLLLLGGAAIASAALLLWIAGLDPQTTMVDAFARIFATDRGNPAIVAANFDPTLIAAEMQRVSKHAADGSNLEAIVNQQHLIATTVRALLCASAGLAAIALLRGRARVLTLAAVAALELLHAGLGPVQTITADRLTTPPAVLAPVLAAPPEAPGVRPRLQRLERPRDPRKSGCLPPNVPGFLHVEDAAAYNPLPPRRLEDFFLAIEPDRDDGKPSVTFHGAGVGGFRDALSLQHPLCDLFGIRFVVTDQPVPTSERIVDRTPEHTGAYRLLERTTTLPRATFVRRIEVVPDRSERLRRLAQRDRDVATTTVLEDATAPVPTATADAAPANVRIVEHEDERVVVTVDTPADGYLRLADPFDPGWRATIDGTPTPVHAADHYLRAVHVPAGRHEVVFTFDAASVVWPPRLSLLAVLLIAALALRRPRLGAGAGDATVAG